MDWKVCHLQLTTWKVSLYCFSKSGRFSLLSLLLQSQGLTEISIVLFLQLKVWKVVLFCSSVAGFLCFPCCCQARALQRSLLSIVPVLQLKVWKSVCFVPLLQVNLWKVIHASWCPLVGHRSNNSSHLSFYSMDPVKNSKLNTLSSGAKGNCVTVLTMCLYPLPQSLLQRNSTCWFKITNKTWRAWS